MNKPFFDVFQSLQLTGIMKDKLTQAEVERVSSTKQKDILHVYLYSKILILKELILRIFPKG